MLFLRSFGASAIISLSIPFCIFGTALGMSLLGRSVNVVSLAGVTFAVGMVLDNSIVALENIDTWRSKSKTADGAAFFGVREVWGALLASTATTAVVFIPIVLWEGEVGQLLRDIAIAMCLSVGASLIFSVLVIPSLSARFLATRDPDAHGRGRIARLGARFRGGVERQVAWLARGTLRPLGVVILAVALSLGAAFAFLPPLEYLPTGNRNLIFAIMVPPPGYSIEELESMGQEVQNDVNVHVGREVGGVPSIHRSFFVGGQDRIFAGAVATEDDGVEGLLTYLRRLHGGIPGMIAFSTQASLFGRSIGGGRAIELEIGGGDLETLTSTGEMLMGLTMEALPDAQVRPEPSLDPGAPEIHVVPRREEAAALGMPPAEVGLVVDALVDGAIVGELGREGEPRVDVVLRAARGEDEHVETPAELASAPVATPSGRVVPLSQLADVVETIGPTVIQRIERRRAITLLIAPSEDVPLEEAIARVRTDVIHRAQTEGLLPAGIDVQITGTAGKLEVAQVQFAGVLALAVLITFLLLAALFEDFIAPLAVMVTVPLAAAGGVVGLRLVDAYLGKQALDLMTALGFLILIGVVVNNAILIVDGALARLRAGEALDDAVPGSVASRVRPIFMSTFTSLAGLAPMVVFSGAGSELYRGVGAIVLGGLALSALMTLYVVPSLFTLLWRARRVVAIALRSTAPPRSSHAP
jgi:HAE1 family hydrophobic/amphiphilic exporter-1